MIVCNIYYYFMHTNGHPCRFVYLEIKVVGSPFGCWEHERKKDMILCYSLFLFCSLFNYKFSIIKLIWYDLIVPTNIHDYWLKKQKKSIHDT